MIRFSELIKTMDMYEEVRIVVMQASPHELYEGKLGKMSLMTYMRAKDMFVYSIAAASVEEEIDCYTSFLNIAVKEVEG